MTIQMQISAHALGETSEEQKAGEEKMLKALSEAVGVLLERGEVYMARVHTQFHGSSDLAQEIRDRSQAAGTPQTTGGVPSEDRGGTAGTA